MQENYASVKQYYNFVSKINKFTEIYSKSIIYTNTNDIFKFVFNQKRIQPKDREKAREGK